MNAIGIVELNSIARGFVAADAMLKAASVGLHASKPVCPGKYAVMVYGKVAEVQASVQAGTDAGGEFVVDHLVIARVHKDVWPAIVGTLAPPEMGALGVIETYSIASTVIAADAAVKAAAVDLIEVRLALGLAGKAFTTLTGEVGAVRAAVEAGAQAASANGMLVEKAVIPAPAKGLAVLSL